MRNQQNGRNPQAGQLSSPHQIRELKERLDSIEVDQESLKSQVDNVEKKAEESASDSGGSGTNATFLYLRAQDGPAIKNNSGSVTFDIMKVEGNDSADVYQGSDFDIRNYDPTKADASGQNFGQKVTLNASDIDGKQTLYLCVSDGSEVVDTDTAVDITDGQGGGYVEAVTPVTATYLQQDASFTINPLKVRGYFYKTGTTTNPEIARVQLYPTYDGSLKATYTKTKDLDSDGTSPISVSVQNQNGNALNEGENAAAKSAREVVVKFTYEDPNTSQTAVATETLYLTTETGPGDYVSYVFQRSDSQPNRPANSAGGTYNDPSVPADWSDAPPVGEKRLWLSKATYEYASDGPVDTDEDGNVWSTPVRLKGEDSGLFTLFASKPKPSDPDKTKISGRPGSTTWNGSSDWKTTPNDLSTDAYYMARAVWKNESWQAFDVTRIKGEKGDAAQIVRIDASSQVFTLQKDGTHAPSSITLRAVQQNIDDPTFEWTYNGSTTQSTNVSILPEDLGDDGTVSVTLSEVGTSNSDEITLVRVTEGADASTVVLSNQNHTYPADQDGSVDSGLFSEGASEIEAYVGASRANVLQSRLGASSASQKGGTTTSGFTHVLYDGPVSDLSLSSGDDITFVGEIRTAQNTSQSGRLLVEFWDGSGGKISDIKSDFENSTEWQSLSANGTVPVGTNRIVLGYAVESVSSGNEQLVEGRYGAVHKSTQPLPAYNAYVSETNINGSVDRSQPQTISYEPSGSMPNDRASALVTFKIVREDGEVEARDKQIEYSKARAGTDSEAFSLSASSQVFAVNKSGNVSTQDPISLLVNRQNISSSVTWKTKNADGTDSSVTLTSKSDSLAELSYSDLEDANKQQVTVRAEAGGYSDEVTIAIIREGKDAVTALLSNENHSYSASSDGSVSDYSTGATTLSVYEGANKLSGGGGTPGFSVSVTKNNVSGSYSDGTFTPSGMSANEGSVEFEITVTKSDGSTQTINKTATYSVVTDGASASSVSIEAESQVFRVSKSGSVSPSQIGLNSVKQNVSSVSWSASDNVSFDSTPKSGYDQSVSKSSLDANGVGQVSITASGGGDSDTLTLAVIREGSDALTPILTNENHTFTAASDGTIAGSEYSSGATDVKIYEGATQLTADSTSNPSNGTFNVSSVTSTNINASKTENASSFTISPSGGMDNSESASIDITIDVVKQNGDEATITKTVTYSKSVAGASGEDAKVLSLSTESQIFGVGKDGSLNTANPVKFTANLQNISDSVQWSTLNIEGNSSPVTFSSTSGETATLSYSDLTSENTQQVTVKAEAGGYSDKITIAVVKEGADAITVLLSNENHSYAAASDGSVADYSTGKTSITVYEGANKLSSGGGTPGYSISTTKTNVSGGLSSNTFTPTGMSADEGSVDFQINVTKSNGDSETFTKTATYSKSLAGPAGSDAKAVSLSAQSQIFAVNQSDAVTTVNPIKFTANKENVSSGFSWSTFDASGNDSPVILTSTNGNTAKLSYSDLTDASEKEVTVRASAGGLFDEITVSIVEDGTDAVTVLLSNENHTYQAQSDGTVPDYSTGETTIKAYRGDSQLSVGSDFSVSKSESNVSGDLVDAVYTPTGMSSGEGSVEFTVTVNKAGGGTETFTKTATYSKSIAGEDNQDFDFLGVDKSKIKDTAGLYTNNDFLGYFRDDANGSLNPNERARAYLDNSGNFYLNDQKNNTGLVYEANLSGGNGIFAVGDINEAKNYHQGNSVSNDSSFLSYSKASANSELVFKGEIDAFGRIESFNPGGEIAVRIDNDETFNTPTSSNSQADTSFTLNSTGDSTNTSVNIESGVNEVEMTISGDAGYIQLGGESYDIPSSIQVELKAATSGKVLVEEWVQVNKSSVSGKTVSASFNGQGYVGESLKIVASNVFTNNGNISVDGVNVKSYTPTTEINARGVQVAYTSTDYVRIGASGITSTGGIETGSGAGVNFTSEGKLYADGSALYWSSGSNLTRIDSKVVEGTSGDSDKLDGNHGSYYLDASNINAGTLGTSYVPNLSASKITSGTFDAARIPSSTQYSDSDAVDAVESEGEIRINDQGYATRDFDTLSVQGSSDAGVSVRTGDKHIYLYNNGSTFKLDAYDDANSTALDFDIGGNGGTVNFPHQPTVGGSNDIWHEGNDGGKSGLVAEYLGQIRAYGSYRRGLEIPDWDGTSAKRRIYFDGSAGQLKIYGRDGDGNNNGAGLHVNDGNGYKKVLLKGNTGFASTSADETITGQWEFTKDIVTSGEEGISIGGVNSGATDYAWLFTANQSAINYVDNDKMSGWQVRFHSSGSDYRTPLYVEANPDKVGVNTTGPRSAFETEGRILQSDGSAPTVDGGGIQSVQSFPRLVLDSPSETFDRKVWELVGGMDGNSGNLAIRAVDDTFSNTTRAIEFIRNGYSMKHVNIPFARVGIGTDNPIDGNGLDVHDGGFSQVTVSSDRSSSEGTNIGAYAWHDSNGDRRGVIHGRTSGMVRIGNQVDSSILNVTADRRVGVLTESPNAQFEATKSIATAGGKGIALQGGSDVGAQDYGVLFNTLGSNSAIYIDESKLDAFSVARFHNSGGGYRSVLKADPGADAITGDTFTAKTFGWQITKEGQADFRRIYTDELVAKSFVTDVTQALAGSDFLTKSVATLSEPFTIPAPSSAHGTVDGGTGYITVRAPATDGSEPFVFEDWLRLRVVDKSSGGLAIVDAWFRIVDHDGNGSTVTDNGDGTYTFDVQRGDSGASAQGKTVGEEAPVLDYGGGGTNDTGSMRRTVEGPNAPLGAIETWSSDPTSDANYTTHFAYGNLSGVSSSNPNINPSGWGLYTENGYFEGEIAATTGEITDHITINNKTRIGTDVWTQQKFPASGTTSWVGTHGSDSATIGVSTPNHVALFWGGAPNFAYMEAKDKSTENQFLAGLDGGTWQTLLKVGGDKILHANRNGNGKVELSSFTVGPERITNGNVHIGNNVGSPWKNNNATVMGYYNNGSIPFMGIRRNTNNYIGLNAASSGYDMVIHSGGDDVFRVEGGTTTIAGWTVSGNELTTNYGPGQIQLGGESKGIWDANATEGMYMTKWNEGNASQIGAVGPDGGWTGIWHDAPGNQYFKAESPDGNTYFQAGESGGDWVVNAEIDNGYGVKAEMGETYGSEATGFRVVDLNDTARQIRMIDRAGNLEFLAYRNSNNFVSIGNGYPRRSGDPYGGSVPGIGITAVANGNVVFETSTQGAYIDNLQVRSNVTIGGNIDFTGDLSQNINKKTVFQVSAQERKIMIADDGGNKTASLTKQGNLTINKIKNYQAISYDATSGNADSTPSTVKYYIDINTPQGPGRIPVYETPDTQAPDTPSNLSVSDGADFAFADIQFTASGDNGGSGIAYFNIYRAGTYNGNYQVVKEVSGSANPGDTVLTTDGAVNAGNKYWYKVSAVDNAGNESSLSGYNSAYITKDFDYQPPGGGGLLDEERA